MVLSSNKSDKVIHSEYQKPIEINDGLLIAYLQNKYNTMGHKSAGLPQQYKQHLLLTSSHNTSNNTVPEVNHSSIRHATAEHHVGLCPQVESQFSNATTARDEAQTKLATPETPTCLSFCR